MTILANANALDSGAAGHHGFTRDFTHAGWFARMHAGWSDCQVMEGSRTLEARWILPGRLGPPVARWFGRFAGEVEIREDFYLGDPGLSGMSVKLRAGTMLEVKLCQGSPGMLEVSGRALGQLEYWRKWSFCRDQVGREQVGPADWIQVRKARRVSWFSLAGGQAGCAAELTEVRAGEQDWWSLGLEATGPDDLLRAEIEAAAAHVFDRPPPDLAEVGPGDSRSYADWIRMRFWKGRRLIIQPG